ncbi:MAG: hypothetical protein OEM52_00095 [bacterium]|nr:hypothetical protein [bacterium]
MLEVTYLQKLSSADCGDTHRFVVTLRHYNQLYRGMLDIVVQTDRSMQRIAPSSLLLNDCDYTIPATSSAVNQLHRML